MSPDAEPALASRPAPAAAEAPTGRLSARPERWKWRARVRQNAHQLRVYRVVVALIGALLIGLGLATGWLPGPGGIPLVLLGLGVWASEFVWAQRLMRVFQRELQRFRSWSRPRQAVAWVVFFACCGLLGYGSLLLVGPPSWLPASADAVLARLPGV